MIHSVKCDNPLFKTISFNRGLNIVLAERTKESKIRDSRNGVGKSTLIEIIHFCLGSDIGETLKNPKLDNWDFTLDLDIAGKRYQISRNTSNPKWIRVNGDCSNWVIVPTVAEETGNQIISRHDLGTCLGILMFDLRSLRPEYKYAPTFRSLISYFIRRNGHRGGFLSPFQHYKQQLPWDIQVNNAYLLDLGWEFASKLQVLKDRIKELNHLRQAAESGMLANLIGDTGELEALKIRLDAQIRKEVEQLDNFKVHPQYEQIERDVDRLTKEIHELVNLILTDKRLLGLYESSLTEEVDAKVDLITKVYEDAGFTFPNSITKRIDDVLAFHRQVVSNRRDFLANEINRLQNDINNRKQTRENLSTTRAELMQTLRKHGALQEFTRLQEIHQKNVSQLQDVLTKLQNLSKFKAGKSEIAIEKELIQQHANADLREREKQRQKAILTFNDYSKELYETPGTLSINFGRSGFKFHVTIERSGSHGIDNMKIFCYDLMLATLWVRKSREIPLIHDSNIFHGVDERQSALALELAASKSSSEGFQYICALNSDMIPRKDFRKGFDFDGFIVTRLTDATADGGLLGTRF